MLKALATFTFLFLLTLSAHAETGTVVKVIDGDTIKVASERGIITVRLYGIDSPEKSQAFGLAAKEFTAQMVDGKIVDYTTFTTELYGRDVAIVLVGTQCLQEQLILQGYAWVYPQYCKKQFCQAWTSLQDISAGNRVGLWASPAPVQPWVWRKQLR